jgi:ABC-type multidrug transport system permease subunit
VNKKRLIGCVLIVSVVWLVFPIPVYGLFMRFFGLVPPTGFRSLDLVFMIPTSILGGFIFVLIFFLAKGSKLGQNGLLYGFLWFLGFSVVSEVGFWIALKYSPIMMVAGVTSGLGLLVNGVITESFSK